MVSKAVHIKDHKSGTADLIFQGQGRLHGKRIAKQI
jgi:hypothetical protein